MRSAGIWAGMVLALALVGGCSDRRERAERKESRATAAARESGAASLSARELAAATAGARDYADSVARVLRSVPGLSRADARALRRDVNRTQIARARALGVRAGTRAEMERLAREGRLVHLRDTTRYWVVDELESSAPYLTPSADAMLTEMARRFQARLDSVGLPPFRMVVTSVMRTAEAQADLRRVNVNASKIVSAHEFGTTLDVSRLRFAAPAAPLPGPPPPAPPDPRVAQLYAESLDSVAVRNAAALSAALGRVILQMRREGKLLVMMERQQAVYHMTVARRLSAARVSVTDCPPAGHSVPSSPLPYAPLSRVSPRDAMG